MCETELAHDDDQIAVIEQKMYIENYPLFFEMLIRASL